MLLLFAGTPVVAHHHDWRTLLSPDELFDDLHRLVIEVLPRVLIILVISWAAIRVLTYFTDRMARVAERHAAAKSRISQTRTLSSVLRARGIGIAGFLAVLQILPLIGFNLGPLLASAGVAGVAIGLACQTVVKDCLNGMLILVEDQYDVGDVIRVAGLTGQVEAMSLRKTTMRDGDGTLYIVPNSQVTTVANLTRDFSVATVNVDIDFSANPDEVIKVLREIAMSVREDPAFKDAFLEDPTLLGVDAIKGSQVTYPIILKTRANEQWAPKRELQRRIRIALEEHRMLPGDPLRVFTTSGPLSLGAHALEPAGKPPAAPDPTAAHAPDINPFSGEGM